MTSPDDAATPVPTSLLTVSLSWRSAHALDAHALLLSQRGLLRTQHDAVYFNAPRHPSQAVTLDQQPQPRTARLSISLPRTESEVDRIVLGVSAPDGGIEEVAGLTVEVLDAAGLVARCDAARPAADREEIAPGSAASSAGTPPTAAAPGYATTPHMPGVPRQTNMPSVEIATTAKDHAPPERGRDTGIMARRATAHAAKDTAPRADDLPGGAAAQIDRPSSREPAHAALPATPSTVGREPRGTSRSAAQSTAPSAGITSTPKILGPATAFPMHEASAAASVDQMPVGAAARIDGPSSWAPTHAAKGVAHETMRAALLAEFFRCEGTWWFRPRSGSWSQLTDMFADFGIATDNNPRRDRLSLRRTEFGDRESERLTPPPPDPDRADWHRAGELLRWWDGRGWTAETAPLPPQDPRVCSRCGRRRGWRVLGSPAPCRACAAEIQEYLSGWRARAWRVLTGAGPRGADWEELWTALRHRHIPADDGRAALRGPGLAYIERLAAFADGEITGDDIADFDAGVAALALSGPLVEELRRRMQRGRALSRMRAGELPAVRAEGLHLDPEERVHLDIAATRIRTLARGERRTDGRLICSNKKLRFVGPEAGVEMPWSRIVSVSATEYSVAIAATSARGGAEFEVDDPDLAAAALEGVLRVAKRLTLAPGRRDSRAIPPEIKAQVWRRDGGACIECGATHYLEFDHIIPLSRGGATSPGNLQVLCRSCNRAKGARI